MKKCVCEGSDNISKSGSTNLDKNMAFSEPVLYTLSTNVAKPTSLFFLLLIHLAAGTFSPLVFLLLLLF